MLIVALISAAAGLLFLVLRRDQVARLRQYGVTEEIQEESRYAEPDPGAEDEEC